MNRQKQLRAERLTQIDTAVTEMLALGDVEGLGATMEMTGWLPNMSAFHEPVWLARAILALAQILEAGDLRDLARVAEFYVRKARATSQERAA